MFRFLPKVFIAGILMLMFSLNAQAQCEFNAETGQYVVAGTDQPCPNPVLTAVPFLTITPDARSGAMGDVGVALDGTPNSLHHNASALAFTEKNFGISATYTPWLRGIVGDVYLAYLAGYYKPDDVQAVGLSLKYFSLGSIEFTNTEGASTGTGMPREWEIGATYARKLSESFSMSVGAKYIYSNLAAGQTLPSSTIEINAANSFAVDIGMQYQSEVVDDQLLTIGLAFTNLGTKVSYTNATEARDFIPTNLALGASYKIDIDEYNSITFAGQANKLLVPSPAIIADTSDILDENGNGILDYREQSLFSGVFGSFTDAPNGFGEEIREITWSLGMEYWYQEQFAVRAGYFHEHVTKGNRQFLTFGFGLRYNSFGLDFSYLVSTSTQINPLANTLRVSLQVGLGVFTGEDESI